MSTVTTAAEAARRDLASAFEGELIGPEDASYDEHRKVYNAMIDKRPALIARCTGPSDVAKVVAFARGATSPWPSAAAATTAPASAPSTTAS
jgi:hypothetical protein